MSAGQRTITTPSPWEWRGNQLYAPAVQSTLLRDVTFWNQDPGDKALIAAAPDLLAALRDLLNDCINFDGGKLTLVFQERAAAAIAKAEGRAEGASTDNKV